jgi:hypothetical protein
LIQELGEMTGQEQLPSGFAQRTLSWLNKHLPSSPVTAWRKKVFNNVEDALRQHLNEAAAAGTIDPQVAYCAGYLWGIAKLINDSPNMAEDPMAGIKMGSELLSTVVRACAGDEEAKQSLLEMLPVYGTYRSFAGSFNDWEGGNYFDSGTKVFQGTLGAIGDVTLVSSIGLKSTRLLTKLNKVPTVVEAKLTPIVRPSAQLIDHFAMDAAKEYLEARGIRNVVALVNESNQGIDYIGWKTLRNGKNVPIFFEVKGHWQSGPPRLRFDQRAMDSFVRSRLETMLDPANARWANVDSEVIEAARKARDYIRSGGKIHGCVVNVDYALNNELRDIQVRYWRRTHPSVPVPWDVGD